MHNEGQIVLEVVGQLSGQLSPHSPAPQWASELEIDLGIGSLERLELVRRLEERLGRRIDEQKAFRARQVSDLLQLDRSENGRPSLQIRDLPPPPRQARTWVEALLYQAEQQPDATAFVLLEGAAPSYGELVARARRVGAGLLALNVRPGDRVALMLPTGVDFFAAFYGVLWIGAVAVPLYPPLRLDQADDFVARQDGILANCQAEVLISLPQLQPMAELLRRRSSLRCVTSVKALSQAGAAPLGPRAELALIQYTSGSTGQPKGVALTHENVLANTWAFGREFGMVSGELMISWLPLYHDMGLIGTTLGSLSHGLPLVLMGPERFLARPVEWLRAFSDYRGTLTAAPNFAYGLCAERIRDEELEGLDLSSWRNALNGAEPIRWATVDAFIRRFAPYGFRASAMYPAYGLAEASLAVTLNPPGRGVRRLGQHISCGRPIEDVEVRIVEGRVEIRGRSVMHGYYGHPPRGDAWHDTGDLGFLHDGELYITGRAKDVVMIGGRCLHPHDVESVLAEVRGIRKGCVAAFGVDDGGSERLVVLAESRGADPRLCLQRVFQETGVRPEVVLLPPRSLPKTPSGKLRRGEARRRYLQGELQPPRLSWKWMFRALWAWLAATRPSLRGLWVWGWVLWCWAELSLLRRPVRPAVRHLLRRLGIRVEGLGGARGPVCLTCNHASLLDPLLLIAAWEGPPLRFVVAEEAGRHPLLRTLCRDHVRVRRGRGQAEEALSKFQQSLERGDCLVVFPEGGIESAPGVRGFATGAFRACGATGARVLPVAIEGSRQLLPQGHWVPARGTVRLHFLPLQSAEGPGFEAAARLAQSTRAAVASALGEVFVESRLARQD